MCSISGIISNKHRNKISKMVRCQSHRAPDDAGVYIDENISLGMGRLKIIDLKSEISLPFQQDHFLLCFNGEIYNYLEIKNGIKNSEVLSPTFNIVYDYNAGNTKILHYDLYRLKNYKDISQLGMFETSNDSIKIVEWPELIESKPKDRVDIQFQYSRLIDSREVQIIGFGKWKDYKFDEI